MALVVPPRYAGGDPTMMALPRTKLEATVMMGPSHSLRFCLLAHLGLEVFNGLKSLGVTVSTLYERRSLAVQDCLGSLEVGID